jgi:hypothetical protein
LKLCHLNGSELQLQVRSLCQRKGPARSPTFSGRDWRKQLPLQQSSREREISAAAEILVF